MNRLLLHSDLISPTEIQSVLSFGDTTLYTIERPWIPSAPGGEPFESCVPAGIYSLRPHKHNGRESLALTNHGLGVYYLPEDRPQGIGRYFILIHAGNWVKDVVGCIAPGLDRGNAMVIHSRDAMQKILAFEPEEIEIVRETSYLPMEAA